MYAHKASISMSKDVQFSFRCDSELRADFVKSCQSIDRSAGQILRDYMRKFISENSMPPLHKNDLHQQATEIDHE